MTDLINFIRIEEDGTLSGNIASLAYDIDLTGERLDSTNEKAPFYRHFAWTPRGGKYLSLLTGHGKLNANLGRYHGQDDDLMAVIPWN